MRKNIFRFSFHRYLGTGRLKLKKIKRQELIYISHILIIYEILKKMEKFNLY